MPKADMPDKIGRYDVVRVLGKGAMGVVFEGRDAGLGRRVAIKTARRDFIESTGNPQEMLERFLREAKTAGSLNHPNIITVYEAEETEDIAYIAMEYLEGGDLFDLLEERSQLPPDEAVAIVAGVCDALAVAHGQGIVHRDITPANILMPEGLPPKVADFGVARVADSVLTKTGQMLGTPEYMSPEQIKAEHQSEIDGRSDLFSAGVVLYELVTGSRPFRGESLAKIMTNVVRNTPIAPKELSDEVNPCLNDVIMKALEKQAGLRYQSAAEMAAALRESLKPEPNPAVTQVGGSAAPDKKAPGADAAPGAGSAWSRLKKKLGLG